MTIYRKKPVEVDMIQWTGDNIAEVGTFVGLIDPPLLMEDPFDVDGPTILSLWVEKSNARCDIAPGGWVARESDGVGFYPIAEEVQATTYESGV